MKHGVSFTRLDGFFQAIVHARLGKLKLLFVYYYRMLQVSIKYQYIQYSTDYSMCLTQVLMKVYILKSYQSNNFGIIFVNTVFMYLSIFTTILFNFRLGGACSHLGALLFKLEKGCELNLNKPNACTSELCGWNKSRKRCHPAPLKEISFKRPKKDNPIPQVDEPFTGTLTGYSSPDPVKFCTEKQECMLRELKQILPKAALLTSVSSDFAVPDSESEGESTDTADESEGNTIPELFTSFFDPASVNYKTTITGGM